MTKEKCPSFQLNEHSKKCESKSIFPHPYNGGVANSTETSQTKPKYNQATLLLGKNLIYKVRLTTFMYLFMAIKPIVSKEAKTIVCCTDAETSHHCWFKFHFPEHTLVIQNGMLRVAMIISVSARLRMRKLGMVCISEYLFTT